MLEVVRWTTKCHNLADVNLECRGSQPRSLSAVTVSAAQASWCKFVLIRAIEFGTTPLNLLINFWISLKLLRAFQIPVIYHDPPYYNIIFLASNPFHLGQTCLSALRDGSKCLARQDTTIIYYPVRKNIAIEYG